MAKTGKIQKRRSMKGGSGILTTYPLNLYNPDTQLQDNYYTTRQMYSDQSVMNPRVLGGGRKNKKTQKKKTEKKREKKGGKKKTESRK